MKRKIKPVALIIFNIIIILAIAWTLRAYVNDYHNRLFQQNLNDITNVNDASAQIAAELTTFHKQKLSDIMSYVQKNQPSYEAFLDYIDSMDSDPEVTYQLLGSDFTGVLIQKDSEGNYPRVDYTNASYQDFQSKLQSATDPADGEVSFSVEFSDQITASRSFARYSYLNLRNQDGNTQTYALLAVYRSSDFINRITLTGGFNGLSSVIINSDGTYVLRTMDFKAEDFFRYLYNYNDLTLDQTNQLKAQLNSTTSGTLRYLDSEERDCIFVYTHVEDSQWICVTCVPVDSFHNANMDLRFTMIIFFLFLILMAFNLLYLLELNHVSKAMAKEAEKANIAKTDFLSRMSHDIRTPINVITGMTELVLQENNPPQTDEYIRNIQSSSSFLLGLVNDILDMNKVESGALELHPVPYHQKDFQNYLSAVITPLCNAKSITFTVKDDVGVSGIMIDTLRFNQIFFNLLSNSIKFTPEHGHIRFNAHLLQRTGNLLTIDFSVTDDGIGMSPEFQQTMFTPFTQETRAESSHLTGTGLGLAIVKSLVELMNGTITVESELDHGTTFHIVLTAEEVQSLPEEANHASESTDLLSGKHILLCEDHPLNAKIIIKLLSAKNVSIDWAENGQIGLEKFTGSAPASYDAILMDIRMPVKNGIDTTREIRRLSRPDALTIPIIALTANAYDTDIQACLDAGMNAHLVKPLDTAKLFSTLIHFTTRS